MKSNRSVKQAGYWPLFAGAASSVGVVRGTEFKLGTAPGLAVGYLMIALLCAFYAYQTKPAASALPET